MAILLAVATVSADNKHKKPKKGDHKDDHKKDDHKEAKDDFKEMKDDHKEMKPWKKEKDDHKPWKKEKHADAAAAADDSYKNALRGQQSEYPNYQQSVTPTYVISVGPFS